MDKLIFLIFKVLIMMKYLQFVQICEDYLPLVNKSIVCINVNQSNQSF